MSGFVALQMWPGLVQLAKEGGANVIESYVFWNGHELSPDNVSQNMCELRYLFPILEYS